MFSQQNTFSSDIFLNHSCEQENKFPPLPTVSVFFKSISFNTGIFSKSKSNFRLETLETDSGFRTEEGSPKEDSPSPKVFPFSWLQNFLYSSKIFCVQALVFFIYMKSSKSSNICAQAQDTDKTIRKARERVAAGGKRETIKRLEVNQSIVVRSDKVMNTI